MTLGFGDVDVVVVVVVLVVVVVVVVEVVIVFFTRSVSGCTWFLTGVGVGGRCCGGCCVWR